MSFTTLIQPADLMGHLDDPRYLVVDCRFDLADPSAGERAWRAGHIPGAAYLHLDRDLSGPVSAATGRHPLPDPASFAATLGRLGVTPATQVVAYDAGPGFFAARLWWMLRWVGHDAAALLDGGLAAWTAAGGATDGSVRQRGHTVFEPRLREGLALSAAALHQELTAGRLSLLDARATERFAGRVEPIDPVAGHVPGAINHPCNANVGPDGRFLPPAELARRYAATLGSQSGGAIACMCGSGVTACHNLLALEVAGIAGARLYPGSWSEWIRDPSRPVARG
ncbi:MAG: sulfurtransferase [Steroidobacteraceae bacterium]|jgi:thiosulfate/3-mercaptopyruvate sulfurtransferase|nr:sulfurtransferase [Steroidobacteraceae bacterium]